MTDTTWPPKPTILQRVTSFLFALVVVSVLTVLVSMLSGCGALAKNTKEKAVNTGGRVYGMRVDTAAGTAGNLAPSVVFGSAEWNYLSIPADTKNARVTVTSEEAGWFTNSIQAKRTCTIILSESPLAEDRPVVGTGAGAAAGAAVGAIAGQGGDEGDGAARPAPPLCGVATNTKTSTTSKSAEDAAPEGDATKWKTP